MGLEDFMDVEKPNSGDNNEQDQQEDLAQFEYGGEKELIDVTLRDIYGVLTETEYEFDKRQLIKDDQYVLESDNGKFYLTVTPPSGAWDRDCIVVNVLESETLYRAIEPYTVFTVEGWQSELKEAVNSVISNKEDLVLCEMCNSVMIIRETNAKGNKIRGCSDYPNCVNKEVLD